MFSTFRRATQTVRGVVSAAAQCSEGGNLANKQACWDGYEKMHIFYKSLLLFAFTIKNIPQDDNYVLYFSLLLFSAKLGSFCG